ncbi:TIGR00270 family protein [Candidatus Woesearchaeota archaeon]|nr:TIGR00270 family protein [Candidatus Woesearchaeota archaeon]
MTNCDMCGKNVEEIFESIIEGSMLKVCNACSSYGKVVSVKKINTENKKEKLKLSEQLKKSLNETYIDSIVVDYNNIIKEAREKKGLKQDELAKIAGERESVIQNLESKKLELNLGLARKLESILSVILVEKSENRLYENKINLKDGALTIGDLLDIKKKEHANKKTTGY